ncbi:DnaJ domain-containing protein [Oscillatoria sp. CS-180]|uniref:J domain-containing protein n=1 Tax=Oscillatoria sp. CS-180 TaxID=3021720 RepID=UPI00232CF17D|nr:J domain-containing protein [Oscillatoria sp. CS-180]MDB9528812.1 DnaJ domain-containing protein [Oscillatoria sp. CS-180]
MPSKPVETDHYRTLEVSEVATQQEIKQAYRRLAKQLHPDTQTVEADHTGIQQVNAAYEVLGDPKARSHYDRERRVQQAGFESENELRDRTNRTARSQEQYRQSRNAARAADDSLQAWVRQVYNPVDRWIGKILSPLKGEIRALSGDPFDDELMENFQAYLENCRESLDKARSRFQSLPNPSNTAAIAANLYYCLNQLEDGIEEMERYTYCYEESYLHTGQELFRISSKLRKEAKQQLKVAGV